MSLKPIGIVVAALLLSGAAPQDQLARARQLYNGRQYDAAIAAALDAARRPDLADAAAVVLGRAYLERYRGSADAADLQRARTTLAGVEPGRLPARDRGELVVGLGELLFFDGHYGAAAEMFGAALGGAAAADAAARECILDWWALSIDHEAQRAVAADRARLYARLLRRVEPAAEGDHPSAAAMYWVAAAAAGMEDFGRAWHAAIAAWIRAPLGAGPRASLRADLERLVQQVVIPGRAAAQAPAADPSRTMAALQAEWHAIKELGPRR